MLETPNLHNVFEIPDNFLTDNELDPSLFDKMNDNGPAPHFDHDAIVAVSNTVTTPEIIHTPETIAHIIMRAGERLSYERELATRSDYDLAA